MPIERDDLTMTIEPSDAPSTPQSEPPSRDEFWGDDSGWSSSAGRRRTAPRAGASSTVRRWWGTVLAGGATTGRSHGTPPHSAATAPVDADPTPVGTSSDPSTSTFVPIPPVDDVAPADTGWDDGWDVEPQPVPRSGADPLLARFGVVAIVAILAVPVVLGINSGSGTDQLRDAAAATLEDVTPPSEEVDPTTAAVDTAPASTSTSLTDATTTDATATDTTPVDTEADAESTALATGALTVDATVASESADEATTTAAAAPVTTIDTCQLEYELSVGDYWIRIADESGIRLADLLGANNATIQTVLVPGRSVCLPAGASMPSPPPAPSTSSSSSNSSSASTQTAAPTTTARPAPATTAAPTTTSAPATPAAPADVEAIIRSVWPDELEERALQIAWRESNYQPTAKNYCCYGLFQIYWNVHQSWLGGIGVTSASQLFDPTTNARAAYALYQRAGGFGPWGG
ncbi:MAG: hypothetical protein WBP59_15115 [Ilumatobacteraceae bacterium]